MTSRLKGRDGFGAQRTRFCITRSVTDLRSTAAERRRIVSNQRIGQWSRRYASPTRLNIVSNYRTFLLERSDVVERLKDGNIHMCFLSRSGYRPFLNPPPSIGNLLLDITLCYSGVVLFFVNFRLGLGLGFRV